MSFAAPAFLLVLLVLPLAALAYARSERRRRAGAQAWANPALLGAVAPRRPGWRRHAPVAAYAVALAVLAVALARPETTVAVPEERASVVLVTDGSTSMRVTDVAPSRLVAARRAADAFLGDVPARIRVGVVTFSRRVQAVRAPSTDREEVRSVLAGLRARGSTAVGEGLAAALRLLDSEVRRGARRPPSSVILLSDGETTSGRAPLPVAREAARRHITVSTVSVGTDAGVLELRGRDGTVRRRPVPPDRTTLRRIAELTGGRFSSAPDAERLKDVYERLGSQISTRDEKREVTAAFAGGGALLLLVGGAMSLRWFARLP
jgi:Ca-activated chloride channel family protein